MLSGRPPSDDPGFADSEDGSTASDRRIEELNRGFMLTVSTVRRTDQ